MGALTQSLLERNLLNSQIANGVRDENRLTDAVFYSRHPEWKGKQIKGAAAPLRQEWIQIRDTLVRPALNARPALNTRPAAPQAPPVPKAVLPPGATYKDPFENIKKYQPGEYNNAYDASFAYWKNQFRADYIKIKVAVANSSLSLGEEGVGQLVFSIDKRAMSDLVMDEALKMSIEHAASGLGQVIFGEGAEGVLSVLGFSAMMLGLMQGLHNERMMGASGPEADEWRRNQRRRFAIAIMAEDIARRTGNNPGDIAIDLNARYNALDPIYNRYQKYVALEDNLRMYQGNVPDHPSPVMRPAPDNEVSVSSDSGRWVRLRGKIVLYGV